MKNSALLSALAAFALAGPACALTPEARLGNMSLGPEYAHRSVEMDSGAEETIDAFSLHAAADASMLDLLWKDLQEDWRLQIKDLEGFRIAMGYAMGDAGVPMFMSYNLVLGVGTLFAATQDIDVGAKWLYHAQGFFLGKTDEEGIGVPTYILLARWKNLYAEMGTGSATKVGDDMALTFFEGRYLLGEGKAGFLGARLDLGRIRKEDSITLINLFWGFFL